MLAQAASAQKASAQTQKVGAQTQKASAQKASAQAQKASAQAQKANAQKASAQKASAQGQKELKGEVLEREITEIKKEVVDARREIAELKEAVADAQRSQRESYAALTQQNAMMQSMMMQLMHFSMRTPPPPPPLPPSPSPMLAPVAAAPISSAAISVPMADERFPRRTYDEFKDAMEGEMEVTDAQLRALQSDYASGLSAVLAAHVRRQLSAEHVAPLKNCAKRPELMAWRTAADGVNRGWVKMGEGDVEMLCKRVMKVMLKHHREGTAAAAEGKKTTQSQISDQVAMTGYISEGITKGKFKREAARHIYDQLIGL